MRLHVRTLAMTLVLLMLATGWTATAQTVPRDYELVADNGYLELFLNPETAEFAVHHRNTDTLWFSSPPDRLKVEKVARGAARDALRSQLSISYFSPEGRQRYMDSYNQSIVYGQFEIDRIPDGVRVSYILGKMWDDMDYLPVIADRVWFEENVLSRVEDERDRSLVLKCYELVEIIPAGGLYGRVDIPGIDVSGTFGDYVLISATLHQLEEKAAALGPESNEAARAKMEKDLLKERQSTVQLVLDQIIANRTDVSLRKDVRYSHVEPLLPSTVYVLKTELPVWDKTDAAAILKEAGFSPDERRSSPIEGSVINQPAGSIEVFHVPVEYTLDGDNLVVRIPYGDIGYPSNVVDSTGNVVSYPLHSVRLLNYFGAAGPSEQGYMLVPDGSGALIELNNGRLLASAYSGEVYGRDRSRTPDPQIPVVSTQLHLPVFGMKSSIGGFFAVIEQGDAIARIVADIAGRTCSYNTVCPEFVVIPRAETQLRGSASSAVRNVYSPELYRGSIAVRYSFFGENEASYVSFAHYYRSYLTATGALPASRLDGDTIPLFVDLIGGIHANEPFLGIPREAIRPLTRFADVREVAGALLDQGVGNLHIRYSGWLKGGKYHIYPAGAPLEPALGNRDEFIALGTDLEAAGVHLYPAVSFLDVYRTNLIDGFSARADASRFLDRRVAQVYTYNYVTGVRREGFEHYILSPVRLGESVSAFLKGYARYGIEGLALSDLGTKLDADYHRGAGRFVDRQTALALHKEQMSRMSADANLSLLLDAPNAYALADASAIVALPMTSAQWNIIDRSVPFYQIVISGLIPYSGPPANFAYDFREHLLRTLETGSYPYLQFIYADSSSIKDTEFAYLYSANYGLWKQTAVDLYRECQAVLGGLIGQRIVDHQRVGANAYKTRFESGVSILVNYGDTEIEVDGVRVGSRSYELIDEE